RGAHRGERRGAGRAHRRRLRGPATPAVGRRRGAPGGLVACRRRAARVRGPPLAGGCVGPRPQRLAGAEARLGGWSLADVERRAEEIGAEAAAAVDAVDDLNGSAEYKRDTGGGL